MARTKSTASAQSTATIGFEAKLWLTFRRDLHPDLRADYFLANGRNSSRS